ncbi:unnamed protein product [Chrysodeixis includens]|uniref:Immunoglobulin domain-containing protein n=1 Tax=Chrysodeixis includens TaxID=689277 RepID=A0A9P0BU00_CHRIL|nr:unnamed protein product [Chrysodeixis includens]
MADSRIYFILILVINYANCNFRHSIQKRVDKINNVSRFMYGDVMADDFQKNYHIEDSLMYPKGDRHKLSAMGALWRDYYTCSARLLQKLSASQTLPGFFIAVFVGGVARLPCPVCLAPGDNRRRRWMVAKSPTSLVFSKVVEHERFVVEGANMTIYNVMPEDGGVFQCEQDGANSSLVILEVVDNDEPYRVVKGPDSRGPQPSPPESYRGVRMFSVWSPWSECSECGRVGRRRRYGMCFVKLHPKLMEKWNNTKKTFVIEDFVKLDDSDIALFKVFSGGIPCRSPYLPPAIKQLNIGQQRPSEIMISMCKVKCKNTTVAVSPDSDSSAIYPGAVVLYSLKEPLPKQPPLAARDTIYADFGRPIAIRCPGTSLRDQPFSWRAGGLRVRARHVAHASAGRVHLNSRDHLVFASVLYVDANLYSCWQGENLAGSVKLIVWEGPAARWSHHVSLGALVLAAGLLLHCVEGALTHRPRPHDVMLYTHM